mmetsp:Transcript_23091/g.37991  ORF Transcript_23091/g.37991 Transcript_23091/m.37991 type:complete len:124 (+) Transcript_23091:30-401(+)|eukprot:CAMPEP_0184656046 /NCGR_PEP_ID=MMETSP0308-20130426/15415_1 /TAXON_ID=38269 /ORGANISM="Gloeochaete witrockiana, Strain SAG 46.84" /LENGTH=123 /DNA_ID=CAMNT_0027092947 /DNA_START=12 /DNA_END=383 /DNA_ORIENTATION=+
MATQVAKKPGVEKQVEAKAPSHRIRITLTGRNVKDLEKVSANLLNKAREHDVKTKGPIRCPTKVLRITTRKSPCGEGTNTWDRFQMRIHKRVIDFYTSSETIKDITKIRIESSVDVELVLTQE